MVVDPLNMTCGQKVRNEKCDSLVDPIKYTSIVRSPVLYDQSQP